jgi:hypothetical protein
MFFYFFSCKIYFSRITKNTYPTWQVSYKFPAFFSKSPRGSIVVLYSSGFPLLLYIFITYVYRQYVSYHRLKTVEFRLKYSLIVTVGATGLFISFSRLVGVAAARLPLYPTMPHIFFICLYRLHYSNMLHCLVSSIFLSILRSQRA